MYLIELYLSLIIILVMIVCFFLFIFKSSREKENHSDDDMSTENVVENRFGNYCEECGATVYDKHKFCTNCGKSL